jgi:hypothetical protein
MAISAVSKHGQFYKCAPVGLIVIVLVIVLAFGHDTIKRQLNAWKLLPEPEHLTELYFTHPNSVPGIYLPGQIQDVSFTVHNLEYRTMKYTYRVTERVANSSHGQLLTDGSFSLRQDQYKTPSLVVAPLDLGQRVQIIVELTNVND